MFTIAVFAGGIRRLSQFETDVLYNINLPVNHISLIYSPFDNSRCVRYLHRRECDEKKRYTRISKRIKKDEKKTVSLAVMQLKTA